ncbi:hypothetical protein ETD83_31815 [Actinomadura soli]|uniref:Uncharacterized protein n=1 Tax=Actinomadura soli TaxID=2508997 RepID=A0A5C4J401_9ACTN|nr:DUF6585 family protein [Actinomadura soli]TMQ91245.1 hypothetical protein ETD83_31815 [Actinomadura soli]
MISGDRLGEPVRVFDGRPAAFRMWALLALMSLAVLSLVPVAILYMRGHVWWVGVPALLIAMGYASAVGWIVGRNRPRVRGRVVVLHTGGLSVTGRGGETGYVWDELTSVTVSGVQNEPDDRTRWTITIVAEDGGVLRLGDDIPDVRALGIAVAEEVTARIVPRHLAAVKAGETVRMGPFSVDLSGVEKDGERLPWPVIREVEIDNGLVTVRAAAGWADLLTVAAQMPDAPAFTALCHQVRDLTELL